MQRSPVKNISAHYCFASSDEYLSKQLTLFQTTTAWGNWKASLLHEAMSTLLASLHARRGTYFQTRNRRGQTPSWFPVFILYRCKIFKAKRRSEVKRKITVCKPCVTCRSTKDAVLYLQCDRPQTSLQMKLTRNSVHWITTHPDCRHPSHMVFTIRQAKKDVG